jgi:unsaturated chondroitin disaccharide hydrolase
MNLRGTPVQCGILFLLTMTFAAEPVFAANVSNPAQMRALVRENFEFGAKQYEGMLKALKNNPNLPRTFEHGKMVAVNSTNWTSGFFPGSLWLIYEYTRDPSWLAAAIDYTARLEGVKRHRGTHDLGFLLGCSFGNGWRLTTNAAYRDVLIEGARSLATRFNPEVGAIRSWDHGRWKYPVIIDNMMNLELLTFAARESGDVRLKKIAVQHANKTLDQHFRPHHSSFHLVEYSTTNGSVLLKQTVQGAADDSSWARGQAWGLYGYTMMFRETRDPIYLSKATNIANFLLSHPRLPEDQIPYWDFDAPGIPNALRDASAGAIMASALIELAGFAEKEATELYLAAARQQLVSLSSPIYRAKVGQNGNFLLMHSVGHLPKNSEVDVPLIYADYYFLEALLRYEAWLTKASTVQR